jgi:hypothetical protein
MLQPLVPLFDSFLVQQTVWFGGSESHTFNRLEEIAMSEFPRTPVLGRRTLQTQPSISWLNKLAFLLVSPLHKTVLNYLGNTYCMSKFST